MSRDVLVQVQSRAPNKKRKLYSFLFLFGVCDWFEAPAFLLVHCPEKNFHWKFFISHEARLIIFCSSEFGAAVPGTIFPVNFHFQLRQILDSSSATRTFCVSKMTVALPLRNRDVTTSAGGDQVF